MEDLLHRSIRQVHAFRPADLLYVTLYLRRFTSTATMSTMTPMSIPINRALLALSVTVCLYAPRLVFSSANACSIRSSFSSADRRCSISSAAICAFAWL